MSWSWNNERVYEYEYGVACRVGQLVGHKMLKENTNYIKFRVRPDNLFTNWFTEWQGYRAPYGGWANQGALKCFHRELFYGWVRTQPDREEHYEMSSNAILKLIRTPNIIMFVNTIDLPKDSYHALRHLARNLRRLEQQELCEKYYKNVEARRYHL